MLALVHKTGTWGWQMCRSIDNLHIEVCKASKETAVCFGLTAAGRASVCASRAVPHARNTVAPISLQDRVEIGGYLYRDLTDLSCSIQANRLLEVP
jgi:hypothetical protein